MSYGTPQALSHVMADEVSWYLKIIICMDCVFEVSYFFIKVIAPLKLKSWGLVYIRLITEG